MKDEVFDKYLEEILNSNHDSAVAVAGGNSPEKAQKNELAEKAVDEDIKNFAEETIRFSGEDMKKFEAKPIHNAEKIPETPAPRRKKKKVRRANYSAYGGLVLSTLVICASLIISLFVIVVGRDFLGIDTNDNEFTLYIEPDWSVADIAQYLTDNGIIEYPGVFTQFCKLRLGSGGVVYPGDIDVKASSSYSDIIDLLMTSREAHETARVTFVEGCTLIDAANILEENGICNAADFIFEYNSTPMDFNFESYVGQSSMKFYRYEGYLFPDTYEFYVGDSVYNIAKKIKQHTDKMLSEDVISRAKEMGYTLEQIVTMASILQLESGEAEEMKNIAGVFYNRLKNPSEYPRLQSDTSYRYINNVIKKYSTISYQEMYDAYDTYTCTGLPIGPICNPGKAAIEAALNPAEHSYYFFCSNLETREFFYAETYDEQLKNQEKAGLSV